MRRASAGFTLVEVVFAMAILAMALFGMISVISYSARNNKVAKERMLALRAAEKQIEIMKSMAVNQIMAAYPTAPTNKRVFSVYQDFDPAVTNVPALLPDPAGQILFPTDPVTGILREDLTAAFTGRATNIDLDENGTIDGNIDKSAVCKTLPVQIVINWKGAAGQAQLVLNYIISK